MGASLGPIQIPITNWYLISLDCATMNEAMARLGHAWQEYRPLPRRGGGRFDVIV